MKHRIKLFLIPFVLLATLLLATACGDSETSYDMNDAKGHTVSVKYDANGGVFIGTSDIMVDSFNITDMERDASGMVQLKLLDPANSARGDFALGNGNKIVGGWFRERTESVDSNGNKVYTYSGKFDFETDTVTVDPNKTYTSAEPVLTLYAMWVDKFSVNFINAETGESLNTYEFNPQGDFDLSLPTWKQKDGKIDMHRFPSVSGKTFDSAYYDAECTQPIQDVIVHPGKVEANGDVTNASMNVYIKYKEGNWYHIFNAKQLGNIAEPNAHYVLEADLDFSQAGAFWPTSFVHGEFTGSIDGNGHTIRNVVIEQSGNNNAKTGLFGSLASDSQISNVTFENVTLYITSGNRYTGATFGLFAGNIASDANLTNVTITNGTIKIDTNCYWQNPDFVIGRLCGMGNSAVIDFSGIKCEMVNGEEVVEDITPVDNEVTLDNGEE